MSPLPEIVVVVLVPSDKYNPEDVSGLATRSPNGVTYRTSAPAEVLVLIGCVVVLGLV